MNKRKQFGFTLAEMLIVVSIFSVISVEAFGVFSSGLNAQRTSLAQQQLLGQTSFLMEYMSRALRMAKKDINGTCITAKSNYETNPPQNNSVRFIDYNDVCTEFFLENGTLKKKIKNTSGIWETWNLTSSNIEVENFNVKLAGEKQTDNIQPRVTISLKLKSKATNLKVQPTIEIQTTISQRNLDIRK